MRLEHDSRRRLALPCGLSAEDALRRSEASFRTLIERLPDGVVVHRGGAIVYANAAALHMLGYDDVESLAGRAVLELIHPEDCATVSQRIAAIHETAAPGVSREERLLRRDGSELTAEVTGLPVTFDGQPAIAKLLHDTTEKRQMLAKLAQADRLASMGLLAASVAHEINNPLAYVLLHLERLVKDLPGVGAALGALRAELVPVLGEEATTTAYRRSGAESALATASVLVQRVHTVADGARQVGRIARNLTAFARAEEDERRHVDVNGLLDKVIDIAANELRFRAAVVREYGDVPLLRANEGRLSQVFLNLLVNAAHAIDEGASEHNVVYVCTTFEDGEVHIAVTDTGRGIAREHLPRLFEPFFTTKARGHGSGLGLSICRDIVHGHGGRIEVESTPGCGSRFTVHIPLGDAGDGEPAPPSGVRAPISLQKRRPRVLLVDDEETLGTTLAALLSDDYDVVLADSGAAVFAMLAQSRNYDAILCDLMMPDVSGMDVYAWLVHEAPELLPRLVFMTGGAFTRSASEFLECLPNRHLEKPFAVMDVIEVLGHVIDKRPAEGQVQHRLPA